MKKSPVALGMFLCEQVIVDVKTNNATPVNCFNSRRLEEFPGRIDFSALAYLTDGMGEMPLEIIVERLDTLDEVFRLNETVKFTNPLQEMRCMLRLRQCTFRVPGPYQVSLIVDRNVVALRKFVVLRKKEHDK
jgi:hypothetical protein